MRRPHSENRMHIILASSRFLCVFWDTFFYCWYCCCCFSTVFLLSLKNIYCTNDDDVGRCCVYMSNNTSDIHAYNIKITIIIIFIFGIRNENKQLPYLFNVSELCFFFWMKSDVLLYIFFFIYHLYTAHNYYYYSKAKRKKKTEMLHFTLCHSLFIEVLYACFYFLYYLSFLQKILKSFLFQFIFFISYLIFLIMMMIFFMSCINACVVVIL